MSDELGPVVVVGAGVIGRGLAQDLAEHGIEVALIDRDEAQLASAREQIARDVRLFAMLRRKSPAPDPKRVLDHLRTGTGLGPVEGAAFVVENITEDASAKRQLWRDLDARAPRGAVLAANTSCVPVGSLAAETSRPEDVIGLHFMNPVPLSTMVEVVRGSDTAERTVERALGLLRRIGKDGVVVRDRPGFVINRVLMPAINDAIRAVHEGVAAPEDVDRLFKGCLGHRMGPLETADLIGLDTVLRSLQVLLDATGDPRYRPCPLLEEHVAAGRLGRKTGRGFFDHDLL